MTPDLDNEVKSDPRIPYLKQCHDDLSLLLPIFEKVVDKTLCLQDYKLSSAHVKGLAQACEQLDTTKVNRMLFSNCGLTPEHMAMLLEGISKMRDCKALTFKQCIFDKKSIDIFP